MNNTNNCTNQNQSSFTFQDLPKNALLNPNAKVIEYDVGGWGNVKVLNHTNFKIIFLLKRFLFDGSIINGCKSFSGGENLIIYSLKEFPHIACFDISRPSIERAFINSNKSRNIGNIAPCHIIDMKCDEKNIIARIPEEYDQAMMLGAQILLMHKEQNSTLNVFPKEIIHLIAMQAMAKYEKLLQELEV